MKGRVASRDNGKTFFFVIDAGQHPDGRRRQVWRSGFKTKGAANVEMRKMLKKVDEGRDPAPARQTTRELVDQWLAGHAAQVRPRTAQRYRDLLDKHVLPKIANVQASQLTPAQVRTCWAEMTSKGLAPATVRQARAALSKAFNDAVGDGVLERNPVTAARSPKVNRPDLAVIRPEQVRLLLAEASTTRWAIPLSISAMTGLRRSETLALSWEHVDLDAGTLHVVRTLHVVPKTKTDASDQTAKRATAEALYFDAPKSEAGRRTIRIPTSLIELLRRHRLAQAQRRLALGVGWHDFDLVCDRGDGRPVHPDSMTKAFKALAKRADIPSRARLHDLRHATAILLRLENVPLIAVAEHLGHSSPGFTLSVYEHVVSEMRDATADALERRLGG